MNKRRPPGAVTLSKLLSLAGALLGLVLLTGAVSPASASASAPAASASAASASAAAVRAVRTIRYDASGSAEFQADVDEGARIWNERVQSVQFTPGTPADVVVYADDGWPRTQPAGLGRGTVWMGRQAVQEGHYPPRIAAHELGHILGLPDDRTGLCEDLMSGASAGTGCRNPNPNPAEIAEVEANFQNGVARVAAGALLTEEPAAARR
ncbi:snapalysin family zinc-dependent metalloprotease [Actinomadura xylanilytica]|uniref:snapalysin family zinc-dependent metalloprotease n=1 Tax=Actinomadura xylanilytica TaxID=887459 RepID=UPI00255B127C|nr:snapalysin family zinc-dependent metalloprotease [Actinomadura xylanilytica]MDL4775457.1 snapalysin family zinc-dependent metalloprotease [Actinomadura xylanilytica]